MLPNEEGDAVREYEAMHEEKYGAIGQGKTREVKKKRMQKPRRMKKERVERGKEKRRKKRTKW